MTSISDSDRLSDLERRVARLESELLGARPVLLEIRDLVDGLPQRLDQIETRLSAIDQAIRDRGGNGQAQP